MNEVAQAVARPPTSAAPSLRRQAAAIKHAWAGGREPDACAALRQHPDLLADKSLVLDLAYEEYCLRREAGQPLDPEAFCDRFPAFRASLRRLIAAHQFLEDNAPLLAEAPPPRWPEPGERFGDFTLLRELGRGAFARVFLATEASTGDRPVAVKLSLEGADEAKTLGRLAHANVVPVWSARQDEATGLAVVCMPFLGSATLHDVLDQAFPRPGTTPPRRASVILEAIRTTAHPDDPVVEPRPPDPCLRHGSYVDGVAHLARQMAEALAFVHAQQVCHRDLKPSNVLLSPDGRPLLLDFNLAADGRLAAPRLGGTLPYVAPEQVRALLSLETGPASLDERADVFSVGVIVYELLTGTHPFGPVPQNLPAAELGGLLLQRHRAGCRSLRAANPDVERPLAQLIERCLAFNPDDRPRSAAELAAGLKRHFAPPRRLRRWAARHVLGLLLAGCLLLGAAWAGSRDPASVREYKDGLAALRAGDYPKAEWCFDRSLKADDSKPDVWFARGRARLARGDVSAALQDFVDADQRRQNHGPTLACMAYCQILVRKHDLAIAASDRALKAGFQSAGLFNNRAFACLQGMYGRYQHIKSKEAGDNLEQALERDPNLLAALYNRAILALMVKLNAPKTPLPDLAVDDIQRVVAVLGNSSPTADLYYDAARICAAASGPKAPEAGVIINYLRQAIALGKDPKRIKDPDIQRKLKGNQAFEELLKLEPGPASPPLELRLVDPLAGLSD